jgi:hypothetical protein
MSIAIDQPQQTNVLLDSEGRSYRLALHVCFWRLADKPIALKFARFRTKADECPFSGSGCLSAYDPKAKYPPMLRASR